MIIEAGYDLQQLLLLRLRDDPYDSGLLGLVCLDTDLRFLFCRAVADVEIDVDTEVIHTGQVDSIIDGADVSGARYFAVGHFVRCVGRDHPLRLLDIHGRIKAAGEKRGLRLLSYLVMDDEHWCSTGPMYDFRSYPSAEDLPRAVVIRGPHPFDCGCPGCDPRQRSIVLRPASESEDEQLGP